MGLLGKFGHFITNHVAGGVRNNMLLKNYNKLLSSTNCNKYLASDKKMIFLYSIFYVFIQNSI